MMLWDNIKNIYDYQAAIDVIGIWGIMGFTITHIPPYRGWQQWQRGNRLKTITYSTFLI